MITLLFPGAGPTCDPIFRLPDEANGTNGLPKSIEGIAGYISALRSRESERFAGDLDFVRRAKAPAVERPVSFRKSLGQILTEVFHQGERALLTDASRWTHVDIPFTDDMPPDRAQEDNVLPTTDRHMPVPGAPFLLLWHRDIDPARTLRLDDPDEFAQVYAGAIKVGDVFLVGERQEMIGLGCENKPPHRSHLAHNPRPMSYDSHHTFGMRLYA